MVRQHIVLLAAWHAAAMRSTRRDLPQGGHIRTEAAAGIVVGEPLVDVQ